MATVVVDRPAGVAPPAAAREGFRSDINGLRAIAVALVVAFHLGRGLVGGGFVGVDVFFAISGYLMTRMIVGGLGSGRFGLRRFYVARVRRIWPALAGLCVGLCVFGAVGLDPWTFHDLAVKLPFALLFISNFAFASRGGYFAEDARSNWFLHTWSLSVEWQFYLIYPLLLIALWRWPPTQRRMWPILGGIALASFALAIAAQRHYANLDFYMLPTRAWELLAGALCVPVERRLALGPAQRLGLHLAGLALIAVGALAAGPGAPWPSFLTVPPVVGASLVIAAGAQKTYWADSPTVALLGRASYSIYLWHWPVVVWLYNSHVAITWSVAAVALTVILALSAGSYWLVERRLTDWLFQPRPWRWAVGGVAVAAAAGVAAAASATHGLEALRTLGATPSVRAALADDRRADKDWTYPSICGRYFHRGLLEFCQIGDPAARQVLLMGDSHAEELSPRYVHAFDGRPGDGLTLLTLPGCIPIPGVAGKSRPACAEAWTEAYRYAGMAGFRRIVITAAWPLYFDAAPGDLAAIARIDGPGGQNGPAASAAGLSQAAHARLVVAVKGLQAHGAEVVLLQDTPGAVSANPRELYSRAFWHGAIASAPLSRSRYEASTASERNRLAEVARATGATLVDPLGSFCSGDACPVMQDGRTLYKDYGHFRASMMTSPRFAFYDPWLAPRLDPTPAASAVAAPIRLK